MLAFRALRDLLGRRSSYGDAIEHEKVDLVKIVRLYALVSRMRVLSARRVVERADGVMRLIVRTYRAPNRSVGDVVGHIEDAGLDLLRDFSEACRVDRRDVFGAQLD